jgi:hypothetical protein
MAERFNQWLLERCQSDEEEEWAIELVQTAIKTALADPQDHTAQRASKKRKIIHRNRAAAHNQLIQDYFKPGATYEDSFRRRYRMRRNLFDQICAAVTKHDIYFLQKSDATGKPGLSPIQKITAALRMMTTGCSADFCDEYIRKHST